MKTRRDDWRVTTGKSPFAGSFKPVSGSDLSQSTEHGSRESPMKKCRQCSKPATLHITEVRKGEATEIHLCETCEGLSQTPEPEEVSTGSRCSIS